MAPATLLLRHSRELRNAHNVLQYEPAVFAFHLSKGAGALVGKGDDLSRCRQHEQLGKRDAYSSFVPGGFPSKRSCAKDFDLFKAPFPVANVNLYRKITRIYIVSIWLSVWIAPRRCFSSSSDLPPHQEIGMPSLSPTMTEGNIARWLKKEGDKVSPGEVLCEVETDKATVEMECMEEGYVAKIIHGDGAKNIKVGERRILQSLKITVSKSSSPPEAKSTAEPKEPKEEPEPAKAPEPKAAKTEDVSHGEDRIFVSPLARKLAEDNNVPLASIKGTGPDGRIVKADVEDYLASRTKGAEVVETVAPQGLDHVDISNSQIRKVTASRLLLSKQTIPHYYLTVDARVDKLMELRQQLNSLQEASGGKRISVNDLVIKAAALALRKVPQCNSSWMNDFIIRQYNNVNINVAVQTDHGLFVPVIKDADKKGLSAIAEEVKQLAQEAKDNSLKPEDYEGGTFTVSNLGGPFGIKQFCAIINPPQSGILAVGSAEKRVIPGSGPDQFEFGSFMSITLSCDHRVIDGAKHSRATSRTHIACCCKANGG